MIDPECVFGDWVCYNVIRRKKCVANQDKAKKWDEIEPYLPKITAHLLIEYLKKVTESSVFMDVQDSGADTP